MPTCPPPLGSSGTTQRWSRSQAGPLDSRGQGQLHEHQPKLKCLFLVPAGPALAPAPTHPPPSACLWGNPLHPEEQTRQEAIGARERPVASPWTRPHLPADSRETAWLEPHHVSSTQGKPV